MKAGRRIIYFSETVLAITAPSENLTHARLRTASSERQLTTANMPKEVKERSGLIVGANSGRVRSSISNRRVPTISGSTWLTNSAEGHPPPAQATHLEGTWETQQEDELRQGDCQRGRWVRL